MATQLFCLPYAGGSCTFFNPLGRHLPADVELCALERAGHGQRMAEPYAETLEEALDDLDAQLEAMFRPGCDLALAGYSLGATLAWHLYFRLVGRDVMPAHLFFMANTAPYVVDPSVPQAEADDDAFIASLVALGGLPPELACERVFRRDFLPMIRADVRLEHLGHVDAPVPLRCPVTVIHASSDDASGAMGAWRACAPDGCDILCVGDTHFFLRDHPVEVAKIIGRALAG